MMEGIAPRRRRSPGISSLETSAGSTTTTTSRSRAARASPSARTSRRASSATAGTSRASATPTTSTASSTRFGVFQKTHGPPDADHRGQPHRLRLAAQAGHRAPRTASRSARTRSGSPSASTAGRRTRSSWCPTACTSTSRPGIGARGADARAGVGRNCFARLPGASIPSSPTSSTRCSGASCPTGWDHDLPVFPADPKGMASRDASGKVLNVLAKNVPWLLGGSADLGPSNKTRLTFDGAGDFEAGHPAGKNLHFGIREHAMGAIVNGMALSKLRAVRLDVLHLQRLRAAGDPPCGAHGAARRSTSSRTTRSASARTARPTSRSSSSRRLRAIPGLIAAAARRCQRGRRGVARTSCSCAISRRCWSLTRQALPTLDRHEVRARPRRRRGAPMCSPTRRGGKPE